jgi:hypothetical protein
MTKSDDLMLAFVLDRQLFRTNSTSQDEVIVTKTEELIYLEYSPLSGSRELLATF